MRQRDVCVTGYGLLSALGEDADAAWREIETAPPGQRCRWDRFAPFGYYPLARFDADREIPAKDIRYMQKSMLSGVYASGLALKAAGLKDDADLLRRVDLVVAACEGERDDALDRALYEARRSAPGTEAAVHEVLVRDLRPSLFLAQLPNLYAANISIVQGVSGSSVTLIGDESAGFHAVRLACRRIQWGRSDVVLVGGVSTAEKLDSQIAFGSAGRLRSKDASDEEGGRLGLGSAAAFVVLESFEHASARGAAVLANVAHWRQLGESSGAEALVTEFASRVDQEPFWIVESSSRDEDHLAARLGGKAVHRRATPGHMGALLEACLPAHLALGTACLRRNASPVLVRCEGHDYGEAAVLLAPVETKAAASWSEGASNAVETLEVQG